MSALVWQFSAAHPERAVCPPPSPGNRSPLQPGPGRRVAIEVDVRRIPGARHDHVKRKGFWAGRTKVAPGFRRHDARRRRAAAPVTREAL